MLPSYAFTNEVISRFFESFKAKIEHSRSMARRRNRYAHDCKVRYVWVREIGDSERPHYHLVILLNKDAYSVLGHFASERNNMFNRLEEAWASALRLPRDAVVGLVHIPENPVYYITRDDERSQAEFARTMLLSGAIRHSPTPAFSNRRSISVGTDPNRSSAAE